MILLLDFFCETAILTPMTRLEAYRKIRKAMAPPSFAFRDKTLYSRKKKFKKALDKRD